MVNINVIGVETEIAGEVFEGSEDDMISYLNRYGYEKRNRVGHDMFLIKKPRK